MIWLFLCIVVAIALAVVLGLTTVEETVVKWGKEESVEKLIWKVSKKHIGCLLALLILIPGFITRVPANSVGIKYSPFSGTSEITLAEGFHGKNIFDKVYKISTEVQTMTVSNLTTQTEDAQFVTSTLDIKYKVNPANAYLIFTQFRTLDKMSDSLIIPTTQRVLELITTNYNVMDVLGEKRSDIYKELEISLTEELAKYGVAFYSISITDMDAGEAIEAAITNEAVAKKTVETAEQELLKAETEAKQKAVVAKAEQDAAKIEAETKIIEAEAEKKANELLQQSLTESILAEKWIEKWNGESPTYYGGNGTDLIFNTGSLE